MPPVSPQPQHQSGGPLRPGVTDAGMREGATHTSGHDYVLSAQSLFAEALEGAISLLRADGGEIATLDRSRHTLVLRARSTRGRSTSQSPHPVQSMPSQPGYHAAHFGVSSPPSLPISGRSSPSHLSPLPAEFDDDMDEQSTLLLPVTQVARSFTPGEGLIGRVWECGEAVILRGEEYRAAVRGPLPTGIDAPWHLAVPIFRPASLASIRAGTEVIGVISVFNRDPHWSFSARDVELLALHTDRVGRAMAVAALSRENQSQTELLDLLRGATDAPGDAHAQYVRVRDLVRHLVDAPSFAIILYHPQNDEISVELAEAEGAALPLASLPTSALPSWWRMVQAGNLICVSTPEQRNAHPETTFLGLSGDQPVQSLLAAPLSTGPTLLGAIVAGSSKPGAYSNEHARRFERVARSAALVLEHTRMAEETRRTLAQSREKTRQLAALNNAVLTLNASLDLDATLQGLAGQAANLTTAKRCDVFLLDETETHLVGRATSAQTPDAAALLARTRIPVEWRHMQTALHSGQFVLLDHLDAEWHDATEMGHLLAEQQMRSCLTLPITYQDPTEPQETPLGMLVVYSPGEHHHFPPEEIGLLQGLASQAAFSISNARLYQRIEQALEQQQELDRLKDEFILTVSHEFRTPLTAIDGYVSLISRHGAKLEPSKLSQFATEIRLATSQLASMVSMLVDANRMSSQPLQVDLKPVQVRRVVEKVIQLQPPEAKARIILEVDNDLWLMADSERLPLVFSNLLSNALKYSAAGSECRITAHRETHAEFAQSAHPRLAHEPSPADWVVLGVRDYGMGISAEDQTKLFHKFVRLAHSLTTPVRGTGLGLWICRQYVEAMGGDIWVESTLTQGAHFQFCLPSTAERTDAE